MLLPAPPGSTPLCGFTQSTPMSPRWRIAGTSSSTCSTAPRASHGTLASGPWTSVTSMTSIRASPRATSGPAPARVWHAVLSLHSLCPLPSPCPPSHALSRRPLRAYPLPQPPAGANEAGRFLLNAWNEAMGAIPNWPMRQPDASSSKPPMQVRAAHTYLLRTPYSLAGTRRQLDASSSKPPMSLHGVQAALLTPSRRKPSQFPG